MKSLTPDLNLNLGVRGKPLQLFAVTPHLPLPPSLTSLTLAKTCASPGFAFTATNAIVHGATGLCVAVAPAPAPTTAISGSLVLGEDCTASSFDFWQVFQLV